MQTWLSLASDRPGDACLKQYGSVDEYCYRKQQRRSTKPGRECDGRGGGGGDDGGFDDGASAEVGESRGKRGARKRGDRAGEGRSSRQVRQSPISSRSTLAQRLPQWLTSNNTSTRSAGLTSCSTDYSCCPPDPSTTHSITSFLPLGVPYTFSHGPF